MPNFLLYSTRWLCFLCQILFLSYSSALFSQWRKHSACVIVAVAWLNIQDRSNSVDDIVIRADNSTQLSVQGGCLSSAQSRRLIIRKFLPTWCRYLCKQAWVLAVSMLRHWVEDINMVDMVDPTHLICMQLKCCQKLSLLAVSYDLRRNLLNSNSLLNRNDIPYALRSIIGCRGVMPSRGTSHRLKPTIHYWLWMMWCHRQRDVTLRMNIGDIEAPILRPASSSNSFIDET